MAKAKKLFHRKWYYPDGAVREMVLWKLPEPTSDRPHGLKYRLFFGLFDGTCLVRYDNEKGKGDHRHIEGIEKLYVFKDVETLITDFMKDIEIARSKK